MESFLLLTSDSRDWQLPTSHLLTPTYAYQDYMLAAMENGVATIY